MTVARFECTAGASGDMFLGAWLDLGVDVEQWQRMLRGLAVDEYEIEIERVKKRGISAVKVHVHTHHSHHHRHLKDIRRIVEDSDLPSVVKEKTLEAFFHLAEAEAAVHGTTVEAIHFHEVGAVDAIVDITGTMIAWHLLGEPECVVTPVEVGGGTVECAHGRMPVPAPATERLLQGYPTYSSGVWGETTTPTGAAIIRTLAQPAGRRPFIGHKSGYGAGSKDLPIANVLRIQLGEWADDGHAGPDWATGIAQGSRAAERDAADARAAGGGPESQRIVQAMVLEANVDDMNPEWAGYVLERLLHRGAMDAWWMPIVMKKGRPGLQLRVLCAPERARALQAEIVAQTSSIGVRMYPVEKLELARESVDVTTPFGTIPVKLARHDGRLVNVAPEFEACRQLAEQAGVPIKQVYQAALAEGVLRFQTEHTMETRLQKEEPKP